MSFHNRIRLPFYISKAQFPTERNVFRKADGTAKTLSVIIRNTYAGITDYIPEDWHRKLIVALSHDEVQIENERYLTDIVLDSDYAIEWPDFKNYPVAQAKFTVQSSPFNATNSNCQTCDEATQLSLVDDYFPDPLNEGTEATFEDVTLNDSICCYPFVLSLVSYNTAYLDSASFDVNGQLTIVIKDTVPSGTNILLVTYRVTCADGSYDEADVFGDIVGTDPGCNPPSNLVFSLVTEDSATATWTAGSPAPASGYIWGLYDGNNPSILLQNGNTAAGVVTVNLTGLVPNFLYLFQVESWCGGAITSTPVQGNFTTTGENTSCGQFSFLVYEDNQDPVVQVSYMDCNGVIQNQGIVRGTPYVFCALLQTPGSQIPFYFNSTAALSFLTYIDLC